MRKRGPRSCWEYWNCPEVVRASCRAYQSKAGRTCMYLRYSLRPAVRRRFGFCAECPWYANCIKVTYKEKSEIYNHYY